MQKRNWAVPLALAAALIVPTVACASMPAVASLQSSLDYKFEWASGESSTGNAIVKNGVSYVDAEAVAAKAGLQTWWGEDRKSFGFTGLRKDFSVKVGNRKAILDGKSVDIGGTFFISDDRPYLPARFLVTALEGNGVDWNKSDWSIAASGLHKYASASGKYGGLIYSADFETGEVYTIMPKGTKRKLASLGGPLYEFVNFKFEKTAGGLLIVTIYDNYGEPHIHNQVFTLVLKNGSVIRQAKTKYFNRFTENVNYYAGHLALTDGKKLRIIEDGTGKVLETIDLVALGGEDDNYFVEGMDDDFILFRANMRGILTLYDRHTGSKTELYKELLDEEQQQFTETNDLPYYGDWLVFEKRDGQTLQFRNDTIFRKDTKKYAYTLPRP